MPNPDLISEVRTNGGTYRNWLSVSVVQSFDDPRGFRSFWLVCAEPSAIAELRLMPGDPGRHRPRRSGADQRGLRRRSAGNPKLMREKGRFRCRECLWLLSLTATVVLIFNVGRNGQQRPEAGAEQPADTSDVPTAAR